MGNRKLIIGTRGSKLALWQSNYIKGVLEANNPGLTVELVKITTTGDKILDAPLAKIGDKGLFTKQLEVALLAGQIDLAVHSLKDLPTQLDEGLTIGAITTREDPHDALVSKHGGGILDLPENAVVATSSLRRRSQLLALRPDISCESIRGNLDTRLRKLDENPKLDALILAKAGMVRLGFDDRISQEISFEQMLPAVGQGALGIEIRDNDARVMELVSQLHDAQTAAGTLAEREFLACLEGGCQIPIGALGRVENGALILDGTVGSLNGEVLLKGQVTGAVEDPQKAGRELADRLLAQGAKKILEEIRLEN